ncbi:MAG TPA: hypothetical protein VNN79_16220 [Actinomycetota bacterium]|nr:hypothetical protein [Actinomycetota bacterium]
MRPSQLTLDGYRWSVHEKEDITTVYLGRYSRETANLVAAELEHRNIVWWYKDPGILASLWEFNGVRMFVDKEHYREAKDIADFISADREAKGWPPLE